MGSYLTIVNDTPDPWICKVGIDGVALTWIMISAAVIAMIPVAIFLHPALAIAGLVIIGGSYTIFGVPEDAMAQIAGANPHGVKIIGHPTSIGVAISEGIVKILKEKGYDVIEAGERKRYGKMSLSLWRQSDCIKVTTGGVDATMSTVSMRPIFSGPTDNSNRDHSIGWWIRKHGEHHQPIHADSAPPPTTQPPPHRVLEEDSTVSST